MMRHEDATAPGAAVSDRPFESIESSREFVGLLQQAVEEAAAEVGEDLRTTPPDGEERRREAFQIVAYKLERLRLHVARSRRLLNDLRDLRLMLDGERLMIPVAVGRAAGHVSGRG